MERYTQIVQHKTSYYTFYLPIQLGMVLAGIKNVESYRKARTILLAMGHFFQVQDDYLDCFGDPNVTGKIGTDIQDGKCSWVIVKAMQIANPSQRKILKYNYGQHNDEAVAKVKEVFNQLDMDGIYRNYEEEVYNDIIKQVDEISIADTDGDQALNPDIFLSLLNKIYKRNA